ncbi:MAG: hypothetical protein BGP11_15930 [Rhodobacterales bacterium 65-51]|uniref:hypothetical protein n=1 Tax=uncultured Gemmobacter sp. TaxID=1095917 RepID=UPI00096694EA|nr:hypothetical protein [uncultured Gemmobacter sp.]OJY27540.1 MAG: hypothetical protein BGP11_15930 [Rhodobacterales bacterium 65-51]
MPEYAKIFTYEVDGLSYTVSLYEQDGQILADISVLEGSMDVNAVYYGDDDFTGKSDSLGGPLNMNGASLDGVKVQWDEAIKLSDPGIGPEGDDKDTYLHAGDTLTVELDADSLDAIDIFGIRATSTSTDEGSIKAVSDDPAEPEYPDEPTYDKVFFGSEFSDTGAPVGGVYILAEEPDPNTWNNVFLPEGTEPTFENYLDYFTSDAIGGDVSTLQGVAFYETDDEGNLNEVFRFDAPEDGFQSSEEVLGAYHDALDAYEEAQGTSDPGADLMAAITLDPDLDGHSYDDGHDQEEDDLELA